MVSKKDRVVFNAVMQLGAKISQFSKAQMIWIAHNYVIKHFDLEELPSADEVTSHFDVRI